MPPITFPTDEEIKDAYNEYVSALGEVAHSWNYLQESLGHLFCDICGLDFSMGFAIWYSSDNDRVQRRMLAAALNAWPEEKWQRTPKAVQEIEWILKETNELANRRNDAVHSPCTISTDEDGHKMYPAAFYGSNAAKNLRNRIKDDGLIAQFKWYTACAETLRLYVQAVETGLRSDKFPWPNRPLLPTSGQRDHRKKTPKNTAPKPPERQPPASQE